MDVREAVEALERCGVMLRVSDSSVLNFDHLEDIPPEAMAFLQQRLEEVCEFLVARDKEEERRQHEYQLIFTGSTGTCAALTAGCPKLLSWVRENHPPMYDDIVSRLPEFARRLWEARSPLAEFKAACDEIVRTTARATAMFYADALVRRGIEPDEE